MNKTIRNMRLGNILNRKKCDIKIYSPKFPFFSFLYPGISLLKELKKVGVLVGSRALDCYTINGHKIIGRSPNDWDFLISRKDFDKLYYDGKIDISEMSMNTKYDNVKYNILTRMFRTYDGYCGHSDLFGIEIDMIIVDNEDLFGEYKIIDDWKISTIDTVHNHQIENGITTDINYFKNKFAYLFNYNK